MENLGLDADMPMGPQIVNRTNRGWRNLAGQVQKGHFFTKEAVDQTVSLNLTADEHFEQALASAGKGDFPMAEANILDPEVECAAGTGPPLAPWA